MITSLLALKLHQPVLQPKRVQRLALLQRLNEGLERGRPVTLISAPAGSGKTMCASEWLDALQHPAAWLSLDAEDNDPVRFFTYLAAGLERVGETLGGQAFPAMHEVQRVLISGQLPPVEVISTALISDVLDLPAHLESPARLGSPSRLELPARLLLVLDDFHLIQDRFILQVFEKLILNLFQAHCPQPLHLVLLTREDPTLPLARLRAGDLLTEIRADDLRFSLEEAGRFLNDVMALGLDPAEIDALEARTEGWAVGLQLAALSMRGRPDPARFIASLSGSHHFILSYLTEEVLNRQGEAVQQFLLDTAILDRLSGELCNALTGRSDSQLVLEQLWKANLFLIPLGDDAAAERTGSAAGAHWFRYHHLFADLLRGRQTVLQGERTPELHRRASRWFAQSAAAVGSGVGMERAALASEAIRHIITAARLAAAAGSTEAANLDYAEAVRLIERHAMEVINQWYARTVQNWIQALPPEWSARSPRTALAFARLHLIRGNFYQAMPYLERLRALFSDEAGAVGRDPGLKAGWLALQSTLLLGQGQPEQALGLAQQALAIIQQSAELQADSETQCQVYLALAVTYQQLDDPARAVAAFQKVIQLGRASANLVIELLGLSALSLMEIQRGNLHAGYDLAWQGIEQAERSGALPPICSGLYGELGQVAFHWNRLDQAEQYLLRAAQVSALNAFSDSEIFYAVFRSRLCQMRGDLDAAGREVHRAAELMRADAPIVVREEVIAQQVIMALIQNNLPAAEQVLLQEPLFAGANTLLPDLPESMPYTHGVLYNCALRILLQRVLKGSAAPGESLKGMQWAGQLIGYLLQRHYISLVLETYLLRAQLHTALGDAERSLADFETALVMAEPEDYISPFVVEGGPVAEALLRLRQRCQPGSAQAAFIDRVLAAFPEGAPHPVAPQEVVQPGANHLPAGKNAASEFYEPLTSRELDVLRWMAEGQTYEEIAARLVISINTVRTHVKSIYGKLGVNNRTAALAAAKQFNLL